MVNIMHTWSALWPNLLANILWVVPAWVVHRALKVVREIRTMVESVKDNTKATEEVSLEFRALKTEVVTRMLEMGERIARLEERDR